MHFYFRCSAYIRCLLLCSFCLTSPCSSCVGTWLLIKFAVQKKKKDKVDWGFHKQTLIMFGFALVIIKLLIIIYSLSSISISLLCNGENLRASPLRMVLGREIPFPISLCSLYGKIGWNDSWGGSIWKMVTFASFCKWSYNIPPLLHGWGGVPPTSSEYKSKNLYICHTFFNFFKKLWFLVCRRSGVHKSQLTTMSKFTYIMLSATK